MKTGGSLGLTVLCLRTLPSSLRSSMERAYLPSDVAALSEHRGWRAPHSCSSFCAAQLAITLLAYLSNLSSPHATTVSTEWLLTGHQCHPCPYPPSSRTARVRGSHRLFPFKGFSGRLDLSPGSPDLRDPHSLSILLSPFANWASP